MKEIKLMKDEYLKIESEILLNLPDEEFEERRQSILENYTKDSGLMVLLAMRVKIEKRIKKLKKI